MNFWSHDWSNRRNFRNQGISFSTMHHTIANYSTGTEIIKNSDTEDTMFSKIHSIPDPLKKTLADTVLTGSIKQKTVYTPTEEEDFYYEAIDSTTETENHSNDQRTDFYPSLTGLTNFISNVIGTISGAMFHRRPESPSQYFDTDSHITQEMAIENWPQSNIADQNKKSNLEQSVVVNDDMNNCRATVAQVEDKISAVRDLLENKTVSSTPRTSSTSRTSSTPRVRYRRPRRAFIEPGSVSDSYDDEPTADSYVSLAHNDYIQYVAVPNNQNQQFCDIEAPRMKIELGIVPESLDLVKIIPDICEKVEISTPTVIKTIVTAETKKEVIASCEDKVAKLKAMLLERRKKSNRPTTVDTIPDPKSVKEIDKTPLIQSKVIPIAKKNDTRFKNPCRLTDKRKRTKHRNNIRNDVVFANEIDSEEMSSVENSPAMKSTMKRIPDIIPIKPNNTDSDYFDEVKGRFHSASTDSDDSFQIVFTDSPKVSRKRRPSDCDSEDSFIVFEDSPDSCFTSNNLFDHTSEESDAESDADSDVSDSGIVCKLSHSFSRTVSDLTDDTLFDETKPLENTSVICEIDNDEVDCAVRTVDYAHKELSPVKEESPEVECVSDCVKSGLLLDEAKKIRRKALPRKSVSFSDKPPKVHVMRVWSFAARQARAGHWERYSIDRDRFKRRIADVDMAISWVLKPQHRSRIMFQRFMPWWNKQNRIEAEEKKRREAEEKIRLEEERIKKEREAIIEDELNEEIVAINSYDDDICEHINGIIERELAEKKLKAITELKDLLTQDKKKMARKKERERKLEAELNKTSQITKDKSSLPNGIVPLKC